MGDAPVHVDDDDGRLVRSLIGRTVVDAVWYDQNPGRDWTEHEVARLTLDDGRVIEFGGWGHEAYGATVEQIEP